jgi:hypothetical protein
VKGVFIHWNFYKRGSPAAPRSPASSCTHFGNKCIM